MQSPNCSECPLCCESALTREEKRRLVVDLLEIAYENRRQHRILESLPRARPNSLIWHEERSVTFGQQANFEPGVYEVSLNYMHYKYYPCSNDCYRRVNVEAEIEYGLNNPLRPSLLVCLGDHQIQPVFYWDIRRQIECSWQWMRDCANGKVESETYSVDDVSKDRRERRYFKITFRPEHPWTCMYRTELHTRDRRHTVFFTWMTEASMIEVGYPEFTGNTRTCDGKHSHAYPTFSDEEVRRRDELHVRITSKACVRVTRPRA